jgi:hypothetical protein
MAVPTTTAIRIADNTSIVVVYIVTSADRRRTPVPLG